MSQCQFIRVDDQQLKEKLEKNGYPLLRQTVNGGYIFLNINKINFEKEPGIIYTNTLSF